MAIAAEALEAGAAGGAAEGGAAAGASKVNLSGAQGKRYFGLRDSGMSHAEALSQVTGAPAKKPAPTSRSTRSASSPAQRATRPSGGGGRSAGATVRQVAGAVSTPSRASQTVTRLIWAAALGLIVLQIASEATGQFWSFKLPNFGAGFTKKPYQPLYGGGASPSSSSPMNNPNPVTSQASGYNPASGQRGPITSQPSGYNPLTGMFGAI